MITREEIGTLFESELGIITDETLKDKVIEAWFIGCKRGKWNSIPELYHMPFTLLTDTHGVNFIEHTKAVTWGAYQLALAQVGSYRKLPYPIDFDRLIVGGLLHDVGKLMEIEYVPPHENGEITGQDENEYRKSHAGKCTRHPISGAILAAEVGFDQETVNTIACHAKEGDGRPQVIETVFIHQADFATFNPLVMKNKGNLIE